MRSYMALSFRRMPCESWQPSTAWSNTPHFRRAMTLISSAMCAVGAGPNE